MRHFAPLPTAHRVGLRFERRDRFQLEHLAERARHAELGAASVTLFTQAAEAARTGEPLIVLCADPVVEPAAMAAAFVRYGVTAPAIEAMRD